MFVHEQKVVEGAERDDMFLIKEQVQRSCQHCGHPLSCPMDDEQRLRPDQVPQARPRSCRFIFLCRPRWYHVWSKWTLRVEYDLLTRRREMLARSCVVLSTGLKSSKGRGPMKFPDAPLSTTISAVDLLCVVRVLRSWSVVATGASFRCQCHIGSE